MEEPKKRVEFFNNDVQIDGMDLSNREVANCILRFGGGELPNFSNSIVHDNEIVFNGAARNTVEFVQRFVRGMPPHQRLGFLRAMGVLPPEGEDG